MTFRELLAHERPLVLPGAHDALSARLIERAGFKAYFIGGFQLVGARYGVPDIGLMGLGEISAGVRDIMSACRLPVLVDCDNGYGDVKTAVHAVQTYERMGAAAVFLEDQLSPKRCGHIAGKQLMSTEQMVANLRAVVANKVRAETFLIARTDARDVYGMEDALRRGEAYLSAGADGLFIESPVDEEELFSDRSHVRRTPVGQYAGRRPDAVASAEDPRRDRLSDYHLWHLGADACGGRDAACLRTPCTRPCRLRWQRHRFRGLQGSCWISTLVQNRDQIRSALRCHLSKEGDF